MKKIMLPVLIFCACLTRLCAQDVDTSAIKLFVDHGDIIRVNFNLVNQVNDFSGVCRRLYTKTVQLVNQTSVAELGYSTFVLTPRFEVNSISLDEAGMAKIYLADCEISLFISRKEYGSSSGASYESFSKKVTGSGSTKEAAILNAVNSISPYDAPLLAFLSRAKQKIDLYFQVNCHQVVKEADRASALQEYGKAIALYFSIPSSAKKCYNDAFEKSMGIYKIYLENQCDTQLLRLKTVIAMAHTKDTVLANRYYSEALRIMSGVNPVAQKCYSEAKVLIAKIEKRFDEQQKRDWEMEQKKLNSSTEVQKEMYKAMEKINSNYQPPAAPGVIIIDK
ncbi:MAG: hypothetical protein WCF67_22820 [Chitinophagaceae bacterium]